MLREALGKARGEDYIDYYCRVKRDEWDSYHSSISSWEIRNQLLFP